MRVTGATVARRWFEEVWNQNRDETIEELMHPEAVFHMEGAEVRTPAEFRQMRDAFMSSFPGLRIEIEDIVSDGDHAVVRWHMSGTHGGSGFGERATKRAVAVRGMSWAVVRDGQVIEGWDSWNVGGLMATIGVQTT
jgi:predicted ester cyclase